MAAAEHYATLLRRCGSLLEGRRIHAQIRDAGGGRLDLDRKNTFLGNLLVEMYARCGDLEQAADSFHRIEEPNVYSWNIMLAAYARKDDHQALQLFTAMPARNEVSWNTMLACFSSVQNHDRAKFLFHRMPHWNAVSATTMITADARAGHFQDAAILFESMPHRSVISWNALIQAFAVCGEIQRAEEVFFRSPAAEAATWDAMIQAYAQNGHLQDARGIFDAVLPQADVVSWTAIVTAYADHDLPCEAKALFDRMPQRNLVSWNALISAFLKNPQLLEGLIQIFAAMPERNASSWNMAIQSHMQSDKLEQALILFAEMPEQDPITWNAMLAGIAAAKRNGMKIRSDFDPIALFRGSESRHNQNLRSWNALLGCVAGDLEAVVQIFQRMPCWDVSSWNAILHECADSHLFHEVMPQRDLISWTLLLTANAQTGDLDSAWRLFLRMPQHDLISLNTMIRHCGPDAAGHLFDLSPHRDASSWCAMLVANAQLGHLQEAKRVFLRMPHQGVAAANALIVACVQNGSDVEFARDLFAEMVQRDIVSWNAMITADAQSGQVEEAKIKFELMPQWDLVSWNCIMSICGQNGMIDETKALFDRMMERDIVSWTGLLTATGAGADSDLGTDQVFTRMPNHSTIAWNALVTCFGQRSKPGAARNAFDSMPERDASSWNAMITVYAQSGHMHEARHMLDKMPLHSMVSWNALMAAYVQQEQAEEALVLVDACASLARLESGREIHREIQEQERQGLLIRSQLLTNAMIHMYGKCGRLESAQEIFDKNKNTLVSWNTMLSIYARSGRHSQAARLFCAMQLEGFMPDSITLLALLASCSHAGMVDRAVALFASMSRDYDQTAEEDHYVCMVDVLGRAGQLDCAETLADCIPCGMTWNTLLSACCCQGDALRGNRAVQRLQHKQACSFVLLSNAYVLNPEVNPEA